MHDEKLESKHIHIISMEKLDGFCPVHFNSYSKYCSNHKKNICAFCENEHNNCQLLNIYNFPEDEKNEIVNSINKAIKIKKEIEDFQKQINESFDKIKTKMDEIIFLKNLIFSYENQEKYIIFNYKNK